MVLPDAHVWWWEEVDVNKKEMGREERCLFDFCTSRYPFAFFLSSFFFSFL